MLDGSGTVRVLDLGTRPAGRRRPIAIRRKRPPARLDTIRGLYMGTVDFMAPEQAEDSHRCRPPGRYLQPRLHALLPIDRPSSL